LPRWIDNPPSLWDQSVAQFDRDHGFSILSIRSMPAVRQRFPRRPIANRSKSRKTAARPNKSGIAGKSDTRSAFPDILPLATSKLNALGDRRSTRLPIQPRFQSPGRQRVESQPRIMRRHSSMVATRADGVKRYGYGSPSRFRDSSTAGDT
jgi:hypothetical protein